MGDDQIVLLQFITDAIVAIGMNEVFMVAVTQGAVSIWMSTRTSVSEDYGVLQSGAIRMGTTVEKNWARLGLTATPPMRGQVQSYLITSNDSVEVGSIRNPEFQDDFLIADSGLHSSVAAVRLVLSKGGVTPPGVITTPTPPDPVPTPTPGPEPEPGEHSWNTLRVFSWLEVRDSYDQWLGIADTRDGNFNVAQAGGVTSDGLNPDDVLASDADQTPVLESWSLKAVPAIERTELMRIPLSCFDWELDSRGQKIGGQGTALARYEELTSRVGAGTVVDLRNLNTNRLFKVVVDDLSFRQTAPGSRGSGFGGVVDLVVRVLA